MNMSKLFILTGSILAISACSSHLAIEESDDWQATGHAWAMQGRPVLDAASISNSEDYNAYLIGYRQGQAEYCQQDAYYLAFSGATYQGICDHINPEFAKVFHHGFVDYEIEKFNAFYDRHIDDYQIDFNTH
ncbi:DUF2799 domain-containing protein [Thaumasiovibrio subtropicus]|uniref:DUF2799 domain-containing protein n=1 Tax=Thaumasiovibrio subtropicus TaxID=1891207 RepID=UPI000B3625D9|nr:DUF2799 domain-containing protein [Thaumasiovibrio subtropicus]